MKFNLDELEAGDTLENESKMHLVIERIINNLFRSLKEEENVISLLKEEEEEISQLDFEEKQIFSQLAKSKLDAEIEIIFKNSSSGKELIFLNSIIIQLALNKPFFIVLTDSLTPISEQRDNIIEAREAIKVLWNEYATVTGRGDFLEFVDYYINDTDFSEDTKELIRSFGVQYISFDFFNAYHLTIRPVLEGSQIYNEHVRPMFFIWIPSDPSFKLVIEIEEFYFSRFPYEPNEEDSVLKSEGFQIQHHDKIDMLMGPLEAGNFLYQDLLNQTKLRGNSSI